MFRLPALLSVVAAASALAGGLTQSLTADPGTAALSPPPYVQAELRASAYDGGVFFVWNDTRSGGLWPDVYGARIAFDGTVLDPAGVQVASGPRAQESADVACGSNVCLVAWRNEGNVEAARPGRTRRSRRSRRAAPTSSLPGPRTSARARTPTCATESSWVEP